MNISLKSLLVPFSNKTKTIDAVQLWEVRWKSRFGAYASDTREEVECFTDVELANEFAQALKNAFSLLRHTSGARVSVIKSK